MKMINNNISAIGEVRMKGKYTLLSIAAIIAANLLLGSGGHVARHPFFSFTLFSISSLGIYLLVFHLLPSSPDKPAMPCWLIIAAAIGLRLAFLDYPLSDDVFRYAWEGMIQNRGINPYIAGPASMAAEFAADPIFKHINHPDVSAIYPPVSMLFCRMVAALSYSPFAFKIAAIILDCSTVMVLAGLTSLWRKPAHYLIIYAWHPLVLFSGAGEGHIDMLHIFFIATALLFFELGEQAKTPRNRKNARAALFFMLGCAVMAKYLAVVLLPFLTTRRNLKYLPLFFVPFMSFIPFFHSNMFQGLITFSGQMAYNDAIPKLLRLFMQGSTYEIGMLIVFATGFSAIWMIFQGDRRRAMLYAYFWCLLCLPSVHIWYLAPLALFIIGRPNRAVFLFLTSAGLGFWVLHHQLNTGEWKEFWAIWTATYIPVLLLFFSDLFNGRQINVGNQSAPKSLDIIIPVLNEEDHLQAMLTSVFKAIENSPLKSIRVYLIDGGSTDRTMAIAKRFDCDILQSVEKGRGMQIAAGIHAGSGEIILILHCDATVHPQAVATMLAAFAESPALCWGVLGHTYDKQNPSMKIVRGMNRLRFNALSIAFGDQGIFVRRATLNEVGGFLEMPLMEDVELSIRLQQYPSKLLGDYLTVSARRWSKKSFGSYFLQVFSFVVSFLIKRKLSFDMNRVAENLYQKYYGIRGDLDNSN